MWKAGKLPVPSEQLPSGSVIIHAQRPECGAWLALALPKNDRRQLVTELVQTL